MTNLKLNQKILVNSSCYFSGEIIKLEKTSVHDVIDGRVVMENNHNWGACPRRNMSEVVSTEEEAEAFFNKVINKLKEESDFKENHLYHIENRGSSVVVVRYIKGKSTTSLRDGAKDIYNRVSTRYGTSFGRSTFEIPSNAKQSFLFDLEQAKIEFTRVIMNNL